MLDKHTRKCRRLWENARDVNVSMLTHIPKKLKLSAHGGIWRILCWKQESVFAANTQLRDPKKHLLGQTYHLTEVY
jgi:hypothetical protein